jgi:nucleotide-binding universal stress UspA family protein
MKPLILVCTDFSSCSEVALARAAEIAGRDEARIFIIHTYEPRRATGLGSRTVAKGDREAWDDSSMHRLREARHRYFGHLPDTDVQYDAVPSSHPSTEICRIAKDTRASLIVVGSHGRTGVLRRLLGSVAESTVRHAPCSVFVVRELAEPGS